MVVRKSKETNTAIQLIPLLYRSVLKGSHPALISNQLDDFIQIIHINTLSYNQPCLVE